MPNIKAGSRVYRNVEKMKLDDLQDVRRALIKEQVKLADKGRQLAGGRGGNNEIAKMDEQFKVLERRIGMVDAFAKALIKKAVPEVPKEYLDSTPTNG
jgi:hypothetical protein